MKITSGFFDNTLEITIEGLPSINSANATIIDILDSYELNRKILRKIDDAS